MLKHFNNLHFGKKLLLSYILVVFLPVLLILSFTVHEMSETMRREERDNARNLFDQSLLQVNNYLSGYISLAQSLQIDSDLINFLNRQYNEQTTYETRFQHAAQMQERYKERLIYESLHGERISIKVKDHNTVLTQSIFSYYTEEDLGTDWYHETLLNPESFVLSAPTQKSGYKMIPLSVNLTPKTGNSNILLIESRASNLCKLLAVSPGDEFYLINHQGYVLACHDQSLIGSTLDQLYPAEWTRTVSSVTSTTLEEGPSSIYIAAQVCHGSSLTPCYLVRIAPCMSGSEMFEAIFSRSAALWILVIVADVVLILLFAGSISRRFSKLVSSVRAVTNGEAQSTLTLEGKDEFAELSRHVHRMTEHILQLNQNVYQSELQAKTAEIRALQSQINPHFLFNCLQAINTSALEKGAFETSDLIVSYSRVIRKSIEWKSNVIPLREEIDLIRDYLLLQSKRFCDRFSYEIDVDDTLLEIPVLKFVLQPLVENSVIHGAEGTAAPCIVTIRAQKTADLLLLSVQDTGKGIPREKLEHIRSVLSMRELPEQDAHIGILNVHRRVQLMYGESYGVTLEAEAGKGTLVTVRLMLPPA